MPVLIVTLVIFGMAIGFLIFFGLKGALQPKRISNLNELVKTGKSASAIKMAKAILAKDSRNAEAHYFLGLAYLLENKAELALMEFKTVNQIAIFTGYLKEGEYRKKMAELFLRFGQDEEALKEFILLIKIEPNDPENYYQAGFIFEERAKTDQAVKFYKKCLELSPNHSNTHLRLGLLYYRAKRNLEAKQELETALRSSPDNYGANFYLGRILKENHDYNGALLAFERSMKDPDLKVKSLVERGSCYMSLKNFDRAQSELERAIKLATDDSDNDILFARYFLAHCYEKARNIDKAIAEWEKIYSKKPTFKDVAEKLSAYQDLRGDDKIKDYVTCSKADFLIMCQKITQAMGLSVQDSSELATGVVKIISVENDSDKWRNTKKMPKVMHFHRTSNNIEEVSLREVHEELKKIGANRCIVVTNTNFSRASLTFAETRPFDLISKDQLTEWLSKITM